MCCNGNTPNSKSEYCARSDNISGRAIHVHLCAIRNRYDDNRLEGECGCDRNRLKIGRPSSTFLNGTE